MIFLGTNGWFSGSICEFSGVYTPENWHDNGKTAIWRCISYWFSGCKSNLSTRIILDDTWHVVAGFTLEIPKQIGCLQGKRPAKMAMVKVNAGVFKGLVWGRVLNQYMGVMAVYFPTGCNNLLEVSGWFRMSSLPIYNWKNWYWWGGISSEEASKFEAETDHRLRSESFTAIPASLIRGLRFHSNQRHKRSRSCPIQYDPLENHRILWGCMSFCHGFVLFEHNSWQYQP